MMAATVSPKPAANVRPMSDGVKLQHIHSYPKVHRAWNAARLTVAEKHSVLDGMDIGLDEGWLLSMIEDVIDAREPEA